MIPSGPISGPAAVPPTMDPRIRPISCDASLAAALEGAEAEICRAFCNAAAVTHPGSNIRSIEAAGGVGLFYGPSDPLNSIKGAGFDTDFDKAKWLELESAFHTTGSPVVIDLCPLAGDPFLSMLADRGYRTAAFETVTVCSLEADHAIEGASHDPAISVFFVAPSDTVGTAAWNRVLNVGFADGGEPIKFAVDFARVRAHLAATEATPSTFMLLATVNGTPAGGAALSFGSATARQPGQPMPRIAFMSGAAVLPEFRRRGIQSALTAARLALAREHRCDYATLCVRGGSASHRNAARAGFQVAYTRPQTVLAPPKYVTVPRPAQTTSVSSLSAVAPESTVSSGTIPPSTTPARPGTSEIPSDPPPRTARA
jgi:ribosomal protein S18 acetylase RimI-like enzyme